MKHYEGPDERGNEAYMQLHVSAKQGRIDFIDNPVPEDGAGACAVLLVTVRDGSAIVRVPLARHQCLNLARAVLEQMA